jgi:S1-C subfamily serine protease
MKKVIFFVLILIVSINCFGQNLPLTRLKYSDINMIKTHFNDNLNKLDPIEGIYSAISYKKLQCSDGININNQDDFKCVIIRMGNRFYFRPLYTSKQLSDFKNDNAINGFIARNCIDIFPIGETNIYDLKRDNEWDPRFNERGRLELSSLFNCEFEIGYNDGICVQNTQYSLVKEYPTPTMYESIKKTNNSELWTGTGYAINNDCIVTNNHVIEDAKNIIVKGIKGNFDIGYKAEVLATDKSNDIAILKIIDSNFKGFGNIPYNIDSRMADVGEDLFVLGYPLTNELGSEIKLTNGIISSRTGYQGNVATYQISAPVQPGNSGGPMFDKKGNVIGIVVAGIPGAENVGYAIKTSYLKILLESV